MKRAIQIVITLSCFALLFWLVDTRELARSFLQINPILGLSALALLFIQNDLITRRWATMVRAFGPHLSHFQMLRIQYMALFAQLFLPTSVGGAAVRTGMLYRAGVPLGIALNSVLLDRIVALIGLALLAVCFMPWFTVSISIQNNLYSIVAIVSGVTAALLVGLVAALWYRSPTFWWQQLKRTPARHLLEPLERASSQLIHPQTVCSALAYSISGQIAAIAAVYMLAIGSGLNVRFLDCILVMPPVMLISALPISVSGWGVREGAMVIAFGLLGVPGEKALALSLQFALLGYLSASPGAIAWAAYPRRKELIRHDNSGSSNTK